MRTSCVRTAAMLLLVAAGPIGAEEDAPPLRVRVTTFEGAPVVAARLEVRRAVPRPFRSPWSAATVPTIEECWRMTPAGADDALVATATTGAGGWARLDALPDGVFDITACVDGRAVRGAQVLSPPVRGAPSPTILLDAGHAVEGRVVTESGEPVAGALVAATYPSAGTARWDDDERPLVVRTDEKGAFRIEGVPKGTVVLRACPAGTWFDRKRLVEVPRQAPVEVVVPHDPLDGTVKDKRTGDPVAGALVFFSTDRRDAPRTLGHATTDANGRFRIAYTDRRLGRGEIRALGYLPGLLVPSDADLAAGRTLEIRAVPAARLRGMVRDTMGPVASVIVTATWLAGFETDSGSVRSAADGTFDLDVCEGLVHVVATRPGLWQEEIPDLDVLLATGRDGEQGLIRVPAAGRDGLEVEIPPLPDVGSVAGRVVTAEGAPVAAPVDAYSDADWHRRRHRTRRRTETGPDGTFLLEDVPVGRAEVHAWPTGPLPGVPVEVEAGKTTSAVAIVLKSERARVRGRVVGLDGNAGAYVVDCNSLRRHRVAADGTFAFPATVCDGAVEVEVVTAEGRTAHAWRAAEAGATVKLGEIALKEPNVRSFRVVAAVGGASIPKAAAALYPVPPYPHGGPPEEPEEPEELPWRAEEEGRIGILVPRAGEWWIQVRAPGFSGINLPVRKVGEEVALKPLAAVTGRVRYGAGGPASGVLVRALSTDPSAPRDDVSTITDADGRFRIDGLSAVPHAIVVESAAGGPSIAGTGLGVDLPGRPLDLVVGTLRTIEGRVVDVLGRPVADAALRARQKWGSALGCTLETRTDATGAFRLTGAFAGKYDLQVSRDDLWIETGPKGVAAGTMDAVLRAEIGLRIAGRVVDADGRPRAGWLVTAWRGWFGVGPRARTDADGRFVIEELAGGPWNLTLGLRSRRSPDSGGQQVPAGTEDVVLVLSLNDR